MVPKAKKCELVPTSSYAAAGYVQPEHYWPIIDTLIIVALTAINLLCFSRTIRGYFLADDFIHVQSLFQIFHGHPELLWQNFLGNWMQAQGTQFYRPFISLTLATDYFFWGVNAIGYHLTNTFYQVVSSIFLFLVSKRLLNEFDRKQSTTAAFFAAALFASYPLHPEVVSWVIGRVDSVSTAFLLAAFWLLLKYQQEKIVWANYVGLSCLAIALISKEMAITLPATLSLYFLFSAHPGSKPRDRLIYSLKYSWSSWAVLAAYLLLRTIAIGTLSGGYSGAIGEGLSASFYRRWFEDGALLKFLFPLNAELFGAEDNLRKLIETLYMFSAITLALRALLYLARRSSAAGFCKYIYFSGAWFIISLLPTYQVWNLTDTLQGSRFTYLATAPFCLLIALLLFPLTRQIASVGLPELRIQRLLSALSCTLLALLVYSFAAITYRNNIPWAHASTQVRNLRSEIEAALSSLPPQQKLVLLNLPQKTQGAHMLYNASMLQVLLSPPLSPTNLKQRVVTFEPMTYGDSDLLTISRLKRMLALPQKYSFFAFDQSQSKLLPLKLTSNMCQPQSATLSLLRKQPSEVQISKPQQIVFFPLFDPPASAADFIDISLSAAAQEPASVTMLLGWQPGPPPGVCPAKYISQEILRDGKAHHYLFAVSQYKSWLMSGQISRLVFLLPAGKYTLNGVYFVDGSALLPSLKIDPATISEELDGSNRISASSGNLIFDVSMIPKATAAAIEISKPDSWFEHYSGELRDRQLSSHSFKVLIQKITRGTFELNAGIFPAAGYYEVRVAGLSNQGKVLAYLSDPINLQVSAEQIYRSAKLK